MDHHLIINKIYVIQFLVSINNIFIINPENPFTVRYIELKVLTTHLFNMVLTLY